MHAAGRELLDLTESLVREYAAELPPLTVVRCVVRSRDEVLLRGVPDDLPLAVEEVARRRLRARCAAQGLVPAQRPGTAS